MDAGRDRRAFGRNENVSVGRFLAGGEQRDFQAGRNVSGESECAQPLIRQPVFQNLRRRHGRGFEQTDRDEPAVGTHIADDRVAAAARLSNRSLIGREPTLGRERALRRSANRPRAVRT